MLTETWGGFSRGHHPVGSRELPAAGGLTYELPARVAGRGCSAARASSTSPSRGVTRPAADISAPQPEFRRADAGRAGGHWPGTTNTSAEAADCVLALIRELLDAAAAGVDRQDVQNFH